MRRYKREVVLVFALIVVAVATAMTALRGQDRNASSHDKQQQINKKDFENQFPIAESTPSKLADTDPIKRAKRQAKGKKYNTTGNQGGLMSTATSSDTGRKSGMRVTRKSASGRLMCFWFMLLDRQECRRHRSNATTRPHRQSMGDTFSFFLTKWLVAQAVEMLYN